MTPGQRHALNHYWPQFGLQLENGRIDLAQVFQRHAPCILEIGFGSGQSLAAIAKAHPEQDFIGIETYQPGVGALLLAMEKAAISNIRIYHTDAVDVLKQCIPELSLAGVQIFFPDPWPKRRHHKRRLIQPEFIDLIATKVQTNGILHLATDWENYAQEMMMVLSNSPAWINTAGPGQFATRSAHRPITTKFEQRGKRSGRAIWELQFVKR